MNQEEAASVNLPLNIYKLLPVRARTASVNLAVMGKLYERLCCPICGCLMKTPVFLRCSHRFCKECFDLNIKKIGQNRQCPLCMTQSKSKKEVREDFCISNLIHMVFGETARARMQMEASEKKIQEKAKANLQNSRAKKQKAETHDQSTPSTQRVIPANPAQKEQPAPSLPQPKDLLNESTSKEMSRETVKEPKEVEKKKKKVASEVPIVIPVEEEYDTATNTDFISKLEKQYEYFGVDLVEAIERDVGIMFSISFQKLEDDPLTIQLQRSNLLTLTKATVRQLTTYLGIQLNVANPNQIRLYVSHLQNNFSAVALDETPKKIHSHLIELKDPNATLSLLNREYWGGCTQDFSVFDADDLVTVVRQPRRLKPSERRIVYYRVDFSPATEQ